MAIKRHKRGNRVYLAEYKSIRQGKKVISKFVRYIGPEDKLSTTDKPRKRVLDRLNLSSSYRAGDVRLLWAIAQDLDFIPIIDRICCGNSHIEGVSPGKLLTLWAINRVIDPESATQLERWVPTTDLPYLAGIASKEFCTYKKQELKLAERTDGKWLILSTDETRDANEAVNEYLEKDFIPEF